tara:strand:+ start:9017 stop:9166 length:150 start_codon:yes stop_codon:yes gene_type:complete
MVLEKLITFLTSSRRSYHAAPTKFRNQKKLYYNGQVIELPENDPGGEHE